MTQTSLAHSGSSYGRWKQTSHCRGSSLTSTTGPLWLKIRSLQYIVAGVLAPLQRVGFVRLADCNGSNAVSSGQEQRLGVQGSSEARIGERKPGHWVCLNWRRRESGRLRTVRSSSYFVARFGDRRGNSTHTHSRKWCTEEQ